MADPSVLILDDGELDDIQESLEEIGAGFARVKGEAIVRGTTAPTELLITTPRRSAQIAPISHDEQGPIRMVIAGEDSNSLRAQLRQTGFDFLVRRPVHPEALRLLLLRCLYKGDERRKSERVSVGSEVSFRSGMVTRRATLVDLSGGGCCLYSRTALEPGKRLRIQIPEALDTGDPVVLIGRVVRATPELAGDHALYNLGVRFDRLAPDVQAELDAVLESRAGGPATLRPSEPLAHESPPRVQPAASPQTSPSESAPPASTPQLQVDFKLEPEPGEESLESTQVAGSISPDSARQLAEQETQQDAPERRRGTRVDYALTVPAFGKRALRVLVGRDLSMGGMRIEPLPGLELGDRLHLAIYGDPGDAPFLIWATVSRDDGAEGLGLVFDPIEPGIASRLEGIVGDLPSVEDLRHDELGSLGTVVSEILER